MAKNKEITVYLFLGFLESGKTKFIQETLEDPRMKNGEKTLLLVCEDGEEEYESSRFKAGKVGVEFIDAIAELNAQNLANLKARRFVFLLPVLADET